VKLKGLRQRAREKGIITLLVGMMLLTMLIPIVGLAIDAGALFAVKARLQTAVDGAALASARSMSEALDLTSQQAAASNAASRWFHANLPNNWMGVGTVTDPTVTFPAAPPKTINVNVVGNAAAPTYFMRVFNISSVSLSAMGQATRRFVNIILVIDRSGSLYQSGSCGFLQSASMSFVNSFVNGQDRLGLVTFGTDYRVDYPPSYTFGTGSPNLPTMLGQIYCFGYTNAAAAYWTAYQQLVTLNDQGALNVILFFTDGMPNTVTFGVTPGGTDNRMPAKKLITPSTFISSGYDNKNPSTCKDSTGKLSGTAGWSPGPFAGVISSYAGIYKKDAASYPASQAVDAQKIGTVEGGYGSCALDVHFNDAGTNYQGGSPSRTIAGPGFYPFFDIAYLPEQDVFGNLTGTGYSGAAYATVNRYPGTYGTSSGKIRVDDIGRGCCTLGVNDSITGAGVNALDNAAQRARDDSMTRNLNVYTYTIGLGNAANGVDNELLQRVANDPNAGNYDATKPVGEYVYAPTTSQLNQAFSKIASQVLRLSK